MSRRNFQTVTIGQPLTSHRNTVQHITRSWDLEQTDKDLWHNSMTTRCIFLAEPLHIAVCNEYKLKYAKLLQRIETIKKNITYKIEKVMLRLMPNENAYYLWQRNKN